MNQCSFVSNLLNDFEIWLQILCANLNGSKYFNH